MLALILRSSLALAVAAPPVDASPQARDYTGTEASEAAPASDLSSPSALAPPAPVSPPAATQSPATAEVVEGPVEADEEADEAPYDPLIDSPEAIRARHWVRSGAVFLALGAVLTIGGIAMSQAKINNPETGAMNCDRLGDPAGNGCTEGGRDRATVALVVPGALLLGGGVAMLTVGKRQQKRLAASVRADRQSFALGLTLRF